MKIILSTRNPSKALQIKEVFNDMEVSILTLAEAGIEGEAVEDGKTLEENAFKKARYAKEKANGDFWLMADDTGLFIQALNGEPGIKAARWAGEKASTDEITEYCLKRLKDVSNRTAVFRTIVALISPDGEEYTFVGEVEGEILSEKRCEPQPKMPYSPLFKPQGESRVWAEMSTEEENEISHRGKAFRKVRDFLEEKLVK